MDLRTNIDHFLYNADQFYNRVSYVYRAVRAKSLKLNQVNFPLKKVK